MKINVPQEQQKLIIDLYNEGLSRAEIKRKINPPFGDLVIKRILLENNIQIRSNPGALTPKDTKQKIPEEIQKKIIDLYQQGYGMTSIAKQLPQPFCFDKVKRVLKDNGVYIRNFSESLEVKPEVELRKYLINDNYNFNSHNGAWVLGFLAADGYLPITRGAKNRVVLTLARKDEDVLYQIKEELEYEGPILQNKSTTGFPNSTLAFTSKILRKKLESYGIVNNKTFKLKEIPKGLSEEFKIDFIRGFFDGDGSVYGSEKEKRISMNITGASKELLEEISTFLADNYGITRVPVRVGKEVKHTAYEIRYRKKDSLKIGEIFYNNNLLCLPRKKNKFFELKEKYPLLRQ